MLVRGQTTEDRIAQIAQGFGQGVNNFMTMRRQAQQDQFAQQNQSANQQLRAQELLMEAQRRQEAMERQAKQDARDERKLGLMELETDAKLRELSLPFNKTREFEKAAAIEALRSKNKKPIMSSEDKVTQKQVEKIATDNAQLYKVSSAMKEALAQLNDPNRSEDEKIKAGQGLLKLLNSAEGSDAVGAEEAQRLGSFLEFQKFNLTNPGPVFGRDLPGFATQVKNYADLLDGRIRRGEEAARGLRSGRSLSELSAPVSQAVGTRQAAPKINPQAVQQIKQMSDEELLRFVQEQ
jgi:hypothetical protein